MRLFETVTLLGAIGRALSGGGVGRRWKLVVKQILRVDLGRGPGEVLGMRHDHLHRSITHAVLSTY